MKRSITLLLAALAFVAHAQMKVGVVSSATGPTSAVGIPQKNSAALLPKKIGSLDVEYFVYDDASDPTQTVTIFKKLLTEHFGLVSDFLR